MSIASSAVSSEPVVVKSPIDAYIREYKRDHQNPVNKGLHMVGIPTILLSLPALVVAPKIGAAMFVGGWALQFIGHAFEGKKPTFFRDPKFLLVGATWYVKRAFAVVTGQDLRDAP